MGRKKFIRGNKGENYDETLPVRKCTENIAKMNIFEYIYFDFKYWSKHKSLLYVINESIKDIARGLFVVLQIPFIPIGLIFEAYLAIKRCKKEMEIFEREKNEG